MKIERLLNILFYLLNRKRVTANELAQRFQVSKRTILRDIDTLSLSGVPIYSEVGAKGGYSIHREYHINSKIMNQENIEYVVLAIESLRGIYGSKLVDETYEKVRHIFTTQKREEHSDRLDLSVLSEHPEVVSRLNSIKEAIREKKQIEFTYTNQKNQTKNVRIDPLQLCYKWYSWYVFGYNHLKSDYRMYKLVRMQEVKQTQNFWQQHEEIKTLFLNYEKQWVQKERHRVLIRYLKSHRQLIEEYFLGEIISEQEELITSKIWLRKGDFVQFSLLLGFGSKIEILEPAFFSKKVQRHLEETLKKNYPNGDR